jgi:hypothetical protein
MYRSTVDFSGWFQLKGKSHNTFGTIIPRNLFFFNFGFEVWWGMKPDSPAWVRPCTDAKIESAPFIETYVTIYFLKQHSIPEGLNHLKHLLHPSSD